jgi:hypothetical protein
MTRTPRRDQLLSSKASWWHFECYNDLANILEKLSLLNYDYNSGHYSCSAYYKHVQRKSFREDSAQWTNLEHSCFCYLQHFQKSISKKGRRLQDTSRSADDQKRQNALFDDVLLLSVWVSVQTA